VYIDLKGKSPMADGLVVACRVEGMPAADWVLIDAGDVIVHLFRPEVRSFYNIEKIWSVEPPSAALGAV
jgi:ribosome-associated protein